MLRLNPKIVILNIEFYFYAGMIQSFGGFVARIGFVISFISLPAVYAVTVTIFPPIVFLVVSGILLLTIIIDL